MNLRSIISWIKNDSPREKIDFLQSMQKLDIKDWDIVIFRYSGRVFPEMVKNLKEVIQPILDERAKNIKILVLEEGMEIGILRNEDLK